jgi:hypothetical protein
MKMPTMWAYTYAPSTLMVMFWLVTYPWPPYSYSTAVAKTTPTWQKYDEAWEKAEALRERVMTYLQKVAIEQGFIVSNAGVIDIGEARPLRATRHTDPGSQWTRE